MKTEKKLQKPKIIHVLALLMLAALVLGADVFLLLSHGKTFSEKENRLLQQFPVLTAAEVTSGRFMTGFENFVEDQIFARNTWISYKLEMDKMLGRKESNGVYLGEEGYLLEEAKEPIRKSFDRNLDAIRDFAASHQENVVFAMVPNAAYICTHLVPEGAPAASQKEVLDEIKDRTSMFLTYADLTDALTVHSKEPLYYKSDHHWTSLGAKYTFEALSPLLGIEEIEDSYQILPVADDFTGTLASASGDFDVRDVIELYVADNTPDYVVEYTGQDLGRTTSVYAEEALETNNKYEVFLGGNFPLIRITTTISNGKHLLLIKDSYANALVPFLLPYFETIQIVDPRYYSDDLETLILRSDITDILLLYNVNTFVEDNHLAIVLEAE